MLEGNAPIGEILRKSSPGCEVELIGLLELCQVAFEPRSFGKQPENAPLVEHADVVLPDHVIDRRELRAVADQDGRETSEPVSHEAACGMGIATAQPAR